MSDFVKSPDTVKLDCEVCLRDIPASEVLMEEAGEYVMYFCGLECYEVWRGQYKQFEQA